MTEDEYDEVCEDVTKRSDFAFLRRYMAGTIAIGCMRGPDFTYPQDQLVKDALDAVDKRGGEGVNQRKVIIAAMLPHALAWLEARKFIQPGKESIDNVRLTDEGKAFAHVEAIFTLLGGA